MTTRRYELSYYEDNSNIIEDQDYYRCTITREKEHTNEYDIAELFQRYLVMAGWSPDVVVTVKYKGDSE